MLVLLALLLAYFLFPSPWGWAGIALAVLWELGQLWFGLWLARRPKRFGPETMIGSIASVVSPCRPDGMVRIGGELWQARCDSGADAGDTVVIREREGLYLVVDRAA